MMRGIVFPPGLLFDPPIADAREPRFALGYRRVHFRGPALPIDGNDAMDAGLVAAGATLGLWARRSRDARRGVQLDLTGGVFALFDLGAPLQDHLNTDFIVGLAGTWREGDWSARLRLVHLSSHLGDEFMLRYPDVRRIGVTYEGVDALVAWQRHAWRVYAGGGYVLHSTPRFGRGSLQVGAEWSGPCVWAPGQGLLRFGPMAAVDINALAARSWTPTLAIKAGLTAQRDGFTFRVLVAYSRGYLPYGQFFDSERVDSFGVELQLEP